MSLHPSALDSGLIDRDCLVFKSASFRRSQVGYPFVSGWPAKLSALLTITKLEALEPVKELPETLQLALAEYEKARWLEAARLYQKVGVQQLSPQDLVRLAICGAMTGDRDLFDSTMEDAFNRYRDSGDVRATARCAFWLGMEAMRRGEHGRGGGWLGRSAQTLEDAPEDCSERGLLLIPAGLQALGQGEPQKALELFSRAQEIGARHNDPDLHSLGTLGRCQSEVETGWVEQAIPALDGLMLDITSPDVSPIVVGIAYCAAVELCRELFEIGRAQEWTQALNSWCDSQEGLVMFRGQCLVYRSELMQFEGAWDSATAQAALARERLSAPARDPAVGAAYYQIGELQRLRGNYAEAEASYRDASQHGHNPEPGMALLSSAQSRHGDAVSAIQRALSEPHSQEKRIRLLLAAVEVSINAGDLEMAETSLAELNEHHVKSGSPLMLALVHRATAAFNIARGEPAEALTKARAAENLLAQYTSPYDSARVKTLLGRACELMGDHRTAEIEFSAARKIFEELGAGPELMAMGAGELGSENQPAQHGLTGREAEVTKLVASGMTNRMIAETLVISEKTVARHLSNIFTKLDISSRAALTAFAYEHGLASPAPSA